MKRIALAAVLLLAAAAIAGVARPEGAHAVDAAPASTDSITVSGTGSVSGVPTSARSRSASTPAPRRRRPRSPRTRARCGR